MARKEKHIMIALDEESHKYLDMWAHNSTTSKTQMLKLIMSAYINGIKSINDGRYSEIGEYPLQLDRVKVVTEFGQDGVTKHTGIMHLDRKIGDKEDRKIALKEREERGVNEYIDINGKPATIKS